MTTHGRYAASDSSFAQSTGNAATKGLALIGVAVVIGFLLLWQGGVGGSGSDALADTDTTTGGDQAVADTTGGTDTEMGASGDSGDADGDAGILGDAGDEADVGDDTTDTVPVTPTTRPLGEVKVAVANGVGVAGLAGTQSTLLSTAGFTTLPVNAAANTDLSAVYYIDGYALEAEAVATELGAGAEVLRAAVDPSALVADPTAVEGFHIFVVLGSDRVLG